MSQPLHVPWFRDPRIRAHLESIRSPLLNIPWPPPPGPEPIPHYDPFEKLSDANLQQIVEDYFLHKYTSSTADTISSSNIVFHKHDESFEWMKPDLEIIGYEDSGKGITFWEYEACYHAIINTFHYSMSLAKAALNVFIRTHTRRLHIDYLKPAPLRSMISMFPLENLHHLTIYIPARPVNKYDFKSFHALIEAIPKLHRTCTGLESFKVEIQWALWEPRKGEESRTNIHPLEAEYLYRLHKDIYNLAVELYAATDHIEHVALESHDQVVMSGDWNEDEKALKNAILLPFTQEVEDMTDPKIVGTGTSIESWMRTYIRAHRMTDPETGGPVMKLETLPFRGSKGPVIFSR